MTEPLIESFGTLVLIIAFLAGALWFVKRYSKKRLSTGEGKRFRVVGRLPLEQKRSLYLVLLGEQLLVVGTSDTGLTLLKEISDPALIAHLTDIDIDSLSLPSGTKIDGSPQKVSAVSSGVQPDENMVSFADFVKSLTKKENRS